ncbi:putative monooxygenase p33MONOX isoform X1 [Notechis scutatus]|uniref:Putative monooxygenase p33MONOX n=1 Tax=Notechis scutatus TaxID=8663 RepID=A0A6J1VLU5_9SAUR|nr:putative monooxygenase p33MONOX isoform X1 [Notechis scutatus]
MTSRRTDVPAIEHGSESLLGKISQPIGMNRRAFNYDDALEDTAPMTPPPSNMTTNILWKEPVIPDHRYEKISQVGEGETSMHPSAKIPPSSSEGNKTPVVKAKATHIIMNSLIAKQTQESIQRFEQQAGLRDVGYTPHKGLSAEETKYHRVAESFHNLKMQTGEMVKEDKQASSAQSTPSSTPHSSPKRSYSSWFSHGAYASVAGPDRGPVDSNTGDSDKVPSEKWSIFGPRALQRSATESGGFTIQTYKGAQKPSPMELMRIQATRVSEDSANFKPPRMDIPPIEEKRRSSHSHNLKPRDLNVLAPSGF